MVRLQLRPYSQFLSLLAHSHERFAWGGEFLLLRSERIGLVPADSGLLLQHDCSVVTLSKLGNGDVFLPQQRARVIRSDRIVVL